MGVRTVCWKCHGEGRYWWEDVAPLDVIDRHGLSCEPPPRVRKRKICDNCFGIGYTHEPIPCGA